MDFYFLVYACHSWANLPKGKAVSVCEISLNPNKICEGSALIFSFCTKGKVKGKVKGFPLARNSLISKVLSVGSKILFC